MMELDGEQDLAQIRREVLQGAAALKSVTTRLPR
jgi:hypothetical protein